MIGDERQKQEGVTFPPFKKARPTLTLVVHWTMHRYRVQSYLFEPHLCPPLPCSLLHPQYLAQC